MLSVKLWRHAGKLAWKDLRVQRGRSLFLIIALALSISGISGVRSAVNAALDALRQGSRESLAGDLCVDTGESITEEQIAALDAMRAEGIDWTLVTIMLTMVSSDQSPDAAFAAVRTIDPQVYPLYGDAKMATDLRGDGVIVSENTLRRLHVHVGDRIRIAGRYFRISALEKADPEQLLGLLSRGMRCVLSRENFENSGIVRGGNSVRNRILLRLPVGFDLRVAKKRLQSLVPEGMVLDYQDVNQNIGLKLDAMTVFLSETALLALALGSMGIAIAIRQGLEQRIEIFAIMKTLGARNAQLALVFIFEIAIVIAGALPLGIALGWIARVSLFSIFRNYVPLPSPSGANSVLALEAAGAAILALIPAVAEPIWMLCRLRPAPVLRNETRRIDSPGRLLAWTSAAVLFAAFVAVACHELGSFIAAFEFSVALAIGAWLSFAGAAACLRGISMAKGLPAAMRLGLGNLTHAGNHAAMIIAAISAGTMMMVGTLESSRVTARAIDITLPYDLSANLLIAGFEETFRQQILAFAEKVPGVQNIEVRTEARVRLISVNGVPWDGPGELYIAGCSSHGLSIDRELQRKFGVTLGSRLDFMSGDREISGTVSTLAEARFAQPLQIDCAQVDRANLVHQAIVRATPGELPAISEAIQNRFPGLAVVSAPEISEVIMDTSRDAQTIARIVSWYSVAAGLCILMTLVAASRRERLREMGVLSALGATPNMLARIYTIEFACLGAIAGIIGSAGAWGLSCLLLGIIFHRWEIRFEWAMAAGAVLCATMLTTAAAWMPTYRLLRQKPMNVLRGV